MDAKSIVTMVILAAAAHWAGPQTLADALPSEEAVPPAAASASAAKPATATDQRQQTPPRQVEPEAASLMLGEQTKVVDRQAKPADQAEPRHEQAEDHQVNVSKHGSVELHVVNKSLGTVLRLLSLEGRRNIIATPAVTGSVTADLYDVSFEEALEAILVSNQCGYRLRGNFIYVYTNEELARMVDESSPPQLRIIRLYYITSEQASAAIEPLLSEAGTVVVSPASELGIAPGADSAGGNASATHDYLVVRDFPERLDQIEKTINLLDIKPQQVLVEATIFRATLNDNNALGIDFTLLGGVDLEMLGSTSMGITSVQTGALPTDRFEEFNSVLTTDFADSVPNGGVTFGVIKDHVGVFLRALEQVTDTTLLANPKILCLNKQKGQVIVGRRDGYLTTTVTETQAIQTVEFLETGTQLIFRPFIGKNGVVRMELHPEDSIGGLTAANLPFETTTEVTTNVQCRDGQTILIGGLFREVTNNSRGQIPLMGDLPWVGDLFRSRSDITQWEEVIILLTVHLVKDEDAYAQESEEQMENMQRARVGLRQGMMWHGRERLSQSHYREAIEHYSEGRTRRALWDLRMSLHNNPRLLPAIQLREEILQKREWDDPGSVTDAFTWRVIRQQIAPGQRPSRFDRPSPPPQDGDSAPENAEPAS